MTLRELATFLDVRLATAYGLVWDQTVKATKENGIWIIDRESAEAYLAQRNARRARIRRSKSRSAIQRSVIDVKACDTRTTVVSA